MSADRAIQNLDAVSSRLATGDGHDTYLGCETRTRTRAVRVWLMSVGDTVIGTGGWLTVGEALGRGWGV